MKTFLVFCSFLLATSCVQEVPVNLPDTNQKTVITSLIDPQSIITLSVFNLLPFSDTTGVKVPKILQISIAENNVIIDYPKGLGPVIYTSVYPLEGSEYKLTLITESDTLTATTDVPEKVYLSSAEYWFSTVPSQNIEKPVEASITFEDPGDKENYYEVQILDVSMKPLLFYQFDQIDDPVLQQECDLDYAPSSFVFSDKQFNGKSYNLHVRFGIGWSPSKPSTAYVLFRSISKEYYQYKKSWHKHIFLQNAPIHWDGELSFNDVYSLLFNGDPVSLYSNIEQGMGIFAAYCQDVKKFRFKE